jgi:hypothetical protein
MDVPEDPCLEIGMILSSAYKATALIPHGLSAQDVPDFSTPFTTGVGWMNAINAAKPPRQTYT